MIETYFNKIGGNTQTTVSQKQPTQTQPSETIQQPTQAGLREITGFKNLLVNNNEQGSLSKE